MKNKKVNINISSKKIAKGAVIVLFGLLLSKALAYLYVALLARLGSFEYGTFSLALAVVSFVSVFAVLGLRIGVMRYISYYKGRHDNRRIKGIILSSLKISLPTSLILMILLLVLSDKISILIFHNPELVPILRLFSLALPFIALSDIFFGIMTGFQKIQYKVFVKDILENIIKLLLTLIILYIGYRTIGVSIIYVFSIIVTSILSYFFLQRKIFPFFKTKIIPILLTKELFFFSFPFIFTGVLDLIIKWTDVFMIGFFRTTSEVGIYNVVLSTSNLLVIIPTALMALFTPIITEFYSKNKSREIDRISKINSKLIFLFNLPLFLIFLLFSKQILNIMFGQEYVVGNGALIVLLVGYIFLSLSHVPNSLLIMIKKTKLIFVISLISALVNIVLNYFLIPKFGMIGGAIATSSSLILIFILTVISSYKLTKIQPLNFDYFKFVIVGIIIFFIIFLSIKYVNIYMDINPILLLFLSSISFSILYFSFIYWLKLLNKEDIQMIRFFLNPKK